MLCSRALHMPSQRTLAAALLGLVTVLGTAQAQTRWRVDAKSSLAWWQMSPNLDHLWGTTCPEEPTWRPGEGRSAGWNINPALLPPRLGVAGVEDTIHVPLYPRRKVRPLCTEAVRGEIVVADMVRYQGIRGQISVRGDALVGGEERRDTYTRQAILQTNRYPEISFTIDSVINVVQNGDTLRGTAVGVFSLHGVQKPMTATVRSFGNPGGGQRVLAKFRIPAKQLVPEYGLSKFSLGLGVGTGIWKDLFMGVDLLLRQEEGSAPGQN